MTAKAAINFDNFREYTVPASALLPNEDMNEVAELQNCIVVCGKLFEAAVNRFQHPRIRRKPNQGTREGNTD